MLLDLRAARGSAHLLVSLWTAVAVSPALAAEAPPATFAQLSERYSAQARPLLAKYCLDCHSADAPESELDLQRFASLDEIRTDSEAWLKVAEMLDAGEMPPAEADQPSDEERGALRAWVADYLRAESYAHVGDPGPVIVRRLNNAEYTYSIQDITGVPLQPAREFPADGAAGEGFTNAAAAMSMSPALVQKYLDAAKGIAAHAVLLPDGFRFSPSTTRSDWTNDKVAEIRQLYRNYTDSAGASQVNLQGIVFDTNDGGRLPVEQYLRATLQEREAIASGAKSIAAVAAEHHLNAKYLGILWRALNDTTPSALLDNLRTRWRTAQVDDSAALAADIAAWQQALWRFTSVGHIGKVGGPTAWQEPVSPLAARQDVRLPLAPADGADELTLYLLTRDAGDGNDADAVIWERPRLVAPGRPDVLLRDIRAVAQQADDLREQIIATAEHALAAADEAERSEKQSDLTELAAKHSVSREVLAAWLEYLGIGAGGNVAIQTHLQDRIVDASGHDFVDGWGTGETPNVVANASDELVRIPGTLKPHSVAMHPSPSLAVAVGWRSPVAAQVHVTGAVQHAHPECGNGVTWTLEVRRGGAVQRLAAGIAHGGAVTPTGDFPRVAVREGDVIALSIGPRDGNHSCDLTAVDLTVASPSETWDLAADVSPDIHAGNPHADRQGRAGVWNFFTEPAQADAPAVIVAGSLLAKWRAAGASEERATIAKSIAALLQQAPADATTPDGQLYRQLLSLGGPLMSHAIASNTPQGAPQDVAESPWGLATSQFGKDLDGAAIDDASLAVQAPHVIAVKIPAELARGAEFVASATLAPGAGDEGSVQLQATTAAPGGVAGLQPSSAVITDAGGAWTSDTERLSFASPILVRDGGAARARMEQAFADFRAVFPAALCYTKIVPVDEVVTLTLFYREDEPLRRLMLDDAQAAELDRLWSELHFISQDALTLVDGLEQLLEFATQDGDPSVFEPLREPVAARAAAFRQAMIDAEPKQLDALVEFAALAYRRPLAPNEAGELRALYQRLRAESLPHDEAFRLTLARILISPSFLYRLETTETQAASASIEGEFNTRALTDWELASRLSYFLWSSPPDAELRELAASGQLRDPQTLRSQARRMLQDRRTERLAREFASQWLHVYEFDTLDEKSERHFPEFAALRGDMYEEVIQFFTAAFRDDASILSYFDADHTFVNARLADFYQLPAADDNEWRRVEGVRSQGRGGVLGFAATLAKQSGASRTSPILRGNWVSEVLLGEKLPKPPPGVPVLPEDEFATAGLTVRQLVEKHTSDARCAKCHVRIDPLGFALEEFDAIGRRRDKDLADRPIDAHTTLPDGAVVDGLPGLRDYLTHGRRDALVRQFCRKLLGYALGRPVRLSDRPLLDEMVARLEQNGFRFTAAIDTILSSPQFLTVRVEE